MRRFSLALLVATLSLAHLGVAGLAQELKIVSPNALADVEGDTQVSPNCCPNPYRFQQVFPAEDFGALPEGGAFITGIAWRPDGDQVTSPKEITLSNTAFRFSTTSAGPGNMSTRFDDNVGADETTVLTGTYTVSTKNTGPSGGPKEFDYISEFETPFLYNPEKGNLLWEWTGSVEASLLSDYFSQPSTVVYASPPSDVGNRFGGFVVELTFVPEPSTAVLSCIGFLSLLAWRPQGTAGGLIRPNARH